MAQPTLNYWSWPNVVPQLISMAILVSIWWLFLPPGSVTEPFIFGAATYLLYSYGSRFFIARAHRRAMRAMSQRDFDFAIREFDASYSFFENHSWIDQYRAVTLMSPSVWSYREMALVNIASVHAAKHDYVAADAACQRVLKEFPDNEVAISTLNMIRSDVPPNEA